MRIDQEQLLHSTFPRFISRYRKLSFCLVTKLLFLIIRWACGTSPKCPHTPPTHLFLYIYIYIVNGLLCETGHGIVHDLTMQCPVSDHLRLRCLVNWWSLLGIWKCTFVIYIYIYIYIYINICLGTPMGPIFSLFWMVSSPFSPVGNLAVWEDDNMAIGGGSLLYRKI